MKGYMKKNIKVFSLIVISLSIFSCTHKPTFSDKREPTAVPAFGGVPFRDVVSCGELYLNESSYEGKPADELEYILSVKCPANSAIQAGVSIPYNEVKPGQKGWITRWTREERTKVQSLQKTKMRKTRINERAAIYARPYLCVKYKTMEGDPCETGRSVTGYAPNFSKNIKNLR